MERSLTSNLSSTSTIIFISHLQPLQISNKAKLHAFFGNFSHFKLKSVPTQDKFLDFLQNEFSHLKWFQKAFFSLNGGACPSGHAQAQSACPPFKWKKAFWKHYERKNSFCKKSRNLSWVGADFSLEWLNFPKNAWNFSLVEIWSGCRCNMKMIFGVFDNLDIKLLSNKIFCHHLLYKNS